MTLLSDREKAEVHALGARNMRPRQIAKALGIPAWTVSRELKEPYDPVTRVITEQETLERIRAVDAEGIEIVTAIMRDPNAPARDRIAAARHLHEQLALRSGAATARIGLEGGQPVDDIDPEQEAATLRTLRDIEQWRSQGVPAEEIVARVFIRRIDQEDVADG